MRRDVVVNKVLVAVEQSAAGVMTLEPPMNQGPSAVVTRNRATRAATLAFPRKVAQVTIETTATVALETSNDGETWVEQANVTASGEIVNDEVWAYTRLNVTAHTAGTVNAVLTLSE